jgi:hypothetical protein
MVLALSVFLQNIYFEKFLPSTIIVSATMVLSGKVLAMLTCLCIITPPGLHQELSDFCGSKHKHFA